MSAAARAGLTTGVAAAIGVVGAAPATAAISRVHRATVVSVDGPGLLTLRTGDKKVAVQLAGIDGPRTLPSGPECGVQGATDALRRLVKRNRRGLIYRTFGSGKRPLRAAATSRVLADLAYNTSGRKSASGRFADDLIDAGWARSGFASTTPAAEIRGAFDSDGVQYGDDSDRGAAARRAGVWGSCGGRMHLPPGQVPPRFRPATWAIDRHGITRAIGGVPLPPGLTPETAVRIDGIAAAFATNAEITVQSIGCVATLPELHLLAAAIEFSESAPEGCTGSLVFAYLSLGPEPVQTENGLRTGQDARAAKALFPEISDDRFGRSPGDSVGLTAIDSLWSWGSALEVGDDGRIMALSTFALRFGEE